jgi:hypothetical protein
LVKFERTHNLSLMEFIRSYQSPPNVGRTQEVRRKYAGGIACSNGYTDRQLLQQTGLKRSGLAE